jgi:hypothetical protein
MEDDDITRAMPRPSVFWLAMIAAFPMAGLDETHVALKALEEGKSKEALEALARATGKLELLAARDPDLAVAPVDVDVVTHDLYATPRAIREAREEAGELLEDGKVQEARRLLSGLASEIVIRVTNLPLATYPDAIKEISPLIDRGETEEAKSALRAALNTGSRVAAAGPPGPEPAALRRSVTRGAAAGRAYEASSSASSSSMIAWNDSKGLAPRR